MMVRKNRLRSPIDYSKTKIYKITNLINGKVYIGQTTNSLDRRFSSHFWKNSGCIFLKRALNKYGKENFKIEQICLAESKKEANKKEKYYIKFYDSTNQEKGYNITKGGNTVSYNCCTPVMCVETGDVFKSIKDASLWAKMSDSSIQAVCCGKKASCGGLDWVYVDRFGNPIPKEKSKRRRNVKIRCVETGEEFSSICELAFKLKKSDTLIHKHLSKEIKSLNGYHYIRLGDNPSKEVVRLSKYGRKNRKKIEIYCVETNVVYNSVSEAAKIFGVYRSQIYDSLILGHKCCGFSFKYFDEKGE